MSNQTDPKYTMGRSQGETERLAQQGALLEPVMRMVLENAGLAADMKVLDVGSGAGDVAMLAARMVGPNGLVVGIDSNPDVLETARRRAAAADLSNITFQHGDFRTIALRDDFDAVVGRFVLMYQADPVEALRQILPRVRRGGIVVFTEWDVRPDLNYYGHFPELKLHHQVMRWTVRAFVKTGVDSSLGYKLFGIFTDAGLPEPFMITTTVMGGRADWDGFQVRADATKSLMPLFEEFGIATSDEVGPDTLAQRLCAEAITARLPVPYGTYVGAWTTKR